MLDSDDPQGSENQDEQQLGVCNWATHGDRYPFIQEFSEFLATVPIDSLKYKLMTYQQRLFAQALWEAENYGGSVAKCEKNLKEIYGPQWYKVTSIKDHMTDQRQYYEYVLILEHQRQWENARKLGKLPKNTETNAPH